MSEAKALPLGWFSTTVEALASLIQYGHTASAEPGGHGPRFLRITDIQDNAVDWRQVPTCTATAEQAAKYRLEDGDIVFARTGATTGKSFLLRAPPDALFASYLIRVRLRPGVDPRYVWYFFQSPDYWLQVEAGKRGIGQPGVNASVLGQIRLPVAPEQQQVRVVAEIEKHLTRIDAGVAALERVQANLKRYRASVLKAAVEGRLVPTEAEVARKERRDYEPATKLLARILKERRARWEADELAKLKAKGRAPTDDRWKARYKEPAPPDTSQLPELPEGWCWATVEQVGDVLLGRQRAPQFLTGRWSRPYLRVANIKDDALDLSDIEQMDFDAVHFEKYRLLPGDILVSEGQSPELVGQSAIYRGGVDGLCFQKTLHRFRAVPGGPSAEFAQVVFRAHVKTGLFTKAASITTNIAHLTLEKFVASRFPLPPEHEQSRIVEEVERRLTVADDAERAIRAQLARADRLRRSVLRHAFEGTLVPQAPAQPVAQPVHSKTNGSSRPASAVRTRVRRASLPLREEEAP
ncbi:MAG: restriction endonuclease subunit S [Myxococcales bacterium]|nr:restriction endonuclease subunit S [Myxococcales bacterium]